jgi:hypothetical protein
MAGTLLCRRAGLACDRAFEFPIPYKVLRPHRATLELRRTPSGWHLGQLKLSGNRVPGLAVKMAVEDWLVARNGLEQDEGKTLNCPPED